MNRDGLDGTAEKLKGKLKQAAGDLTDDERLHDEGVADEAAGSVQEGFGRARLPLPSLPSNTHWVCHLRPRDVSVIFARFWSALGHPI